MIMKRLQARTAFGPGRAGYIHITKATIRTLFGKPVRCEENDNTCEEYTMEIDGVELALYDYHTGYKRLPMNFYEWHIGGPEECIDVLSNYLEEQGISNRITSTEPAFAVIETEA